MIFERNILQGVDILSCTLSIRRECLWPAGVYPCSCRRTMDWLARFWSQGCLRHFYFFFVFLDISTILKDKPICHLFHWIAHFSFGFLCHHCDRIMHGQTMGDVIFRCPEPRMTLCISLARRIPVMGPGTIIPCV